MRGDIGHVYLLSNSALDGIVKIGHTKRPEPELRAEELSASTSIPLPFKVECSWLVEHPTTWEARIHLQLSSCRVARNREFFRIAPIEAEKIINILLFETSEPSQVLLRQLAAMTTLYRRFPNSFKRTDHLIKELELLLGSSHKEERLD